MPQPPLKRAETGEKARRSLAGDLFAAWDRFAAEILKTAPVAAEHSGEDDPT